MFKLKVSDAKLLRDMATAISILVDEATFKIDPEGMKLRAMDPSRVAMIDFEWPKSIMATREGSMARSFKPSGSILNVASSTRIEMAVAISLKSLASDTLSLNTIFPSLAYAYYCKVI